MNYLIDVKRVFLPALYIQFYSDKQLFIFFNVWFGFCGTRYHGQYRSVAFFISRNNWIRIC